MSKHTPGPWIVKERVAGFDILAPESVYAVAEDPGGDYGVIDDLQDARLIAAAPDLLEALEGTAALLEQLGFVSGDSLTVDAARVAIAKAKGE